MFFKETKSALMNREFLAVVTYYATSWVGLNFLQANLQLYNKYVIQENSLFALWTLLIQVSSFFHAIRVCSFLLHRIQTSRNLFLGISSAFFSRVVVHQ
jgi:Na+/melibiose symporter-like transporter